MCKTNGTCDDILRDMFNDHSSDNAAYRIRCYANRWQRALRRERARSAVHAPPVLRQGPSARSR